MATTIAGVIFRGLSPLRVVLTCGIALCVSAVAIVLGMWQYDRYEVRLEARDDYRAALSEPTADLNDVIPADAQHLPPGAEWRTVTVSGVFEQDTTTVLRGRPVDSTPAWQYLAWLDTDDGRSVLVSVGWIPQPGPNEDPAMPQYSDEVVTVTGVVRAWEDDDGKQAADSVSRITPAQLPTPAEPAVPGYLMLREHCDSEGCHDAVVGEPVPLPELTLGSHLSYAWQWWVFAALAPTGANLLLRRDANELARARESYEPATGADREQTEPPSEHEFKPAAAPKSPRVSARRKKRREPTDEEIEDAL